MCGGGQEHQHALRVCSGLTLHRQREFVHDRGLPELFCLSSEPLVLQQFAHILPCERGGPREQYE